MLVNNKRQRSFWSRVEQGDNGCWIWVGGTRSNGYGMFAIKTEEGRWTQTTSHKWAYLTNGGIVPKGYEVDHLCRVRNCVRPDHLEAVTVQENRRRRDLKFSGDFPTNILPLPVIPETEPATKKRDITQECRNGHLYVETGWTPNGEGRRTCSACLKDRAAGALIGGKHGTETHCPSGHPYDEDNTFKRVRPNGSVQRECRTCVLARNRAYKARKKAERQKQ